MVGAHRCNGVDYFVLAHSRCLHDLDADQLVFPLLLRKWKTGDVFMPFGMDGKSKKVSKLFKDEKLSLLEKENTWLLCSNDQIVWVIGMRADDRFRTENTTKNILKIELEN